MLCSKENNLEDRIIELTAKDKTTIKSLHTKLDDKEGGLSLRAVYKSVNKLIAAGVLLKVGKQVMIDHEWARRVSDRLATPTAPLLANKERAVYTFVTVEHLDAFWKTIVLPLEQSTPANETFFYNPHNFWAYLQLARKVKMRIIDISRIQGTMDSSRWGEIRDRIQNLKESTKMSTYRSTSGI